MGRKSQNVFGQAPAADTQGHPSSWADTSSDIRNGEKAKEVDINKLPSCDGLEARTSNNSSHESWALWGFPFIICSSMQKICIVFLMYTRPVLGEGFLPGKTKKTKFLSSFNLSQEKQQKKMWFVQLW